MGHVARASIPLYIIIGRLSVNLPEQSWIQYCEQCSLGGTALGVAFISCELSKLAAQGQGMDIVLKCFEWASRVSAQSFARLHSSALSSTVRYPSLVQVASQNDTAQTRIYMVLASLERNLGTVMVDEHFVLSWDALLACRMHAASAHKQAYQPR